MRRREARLGRLERAVQVAVRAELEAFLNGLGAQLDRPTFERVLEITAGFAEASRQRAQRRMTGS
jgi:hypothetical protein